MKRATIYAALTVVAVIAAISSYSHMAAACTRYGQSPYLAAMMPLSVDGIVVIAGVILADHKRCWPAWGMFLTGLAASIAANVLAAEPNLIARTISAWPAIALLLAVEVLVTKPATETADTAPSPVEATSQETDGTVPIKRGENSRARIAETRRQWPNHGQQQIANHLGLSINTVRKYWNEAA